MIVEHIALAVLAGATVVLVLGLPLLRSYLRDGTIALVHPKDDVQRFVHGAVSSVLLGYGVWVGGLLVLGPEALDVWGAPRVVVGLGLVLALVGLVIVIVAQAQMGRSWRIGIASETTGLVTHGLFRVSRNPIYLGMLCMALGIAMATPAPWTWMGLVLAYILVGLQARAEEAHLHSQHGDAYVEWASRVGRFVPLLGRYHQA